MIYYLPSCKYKAAHRDSNQKIQRYLAGKPDLEIVGCCRVSQHLFQAGDLILTNCTSCAAITDEASPQAREISVYEYLLEDPEFVWPDHQGEEITVQDCFRSIYKPQMMLAVRECLKRMNIVPVEIEENMERSRFDGTFQFSNVSESNLKLAPNFYTKIQDEYIDVIAPEEQKARMIAWVRQYKTNRIVAYCNSCLNGILLGGVNGVHLLDLITCNLPEG